MGACQKEWKIWEIGLIFFALQIGRGKYFTIVKTAINIYDSHPFALEWSGEHGNAQDLTRTKTCPTQRETFATEMDGVEEWMMAWMD